MSGTPLDPAAAALVAAAASVSGPCPRDPQAQQEWERTVQDTAFGLLRLVPAVVERSMVLAACTPITGVITAVDEVSGRGRITIRPTMGTGEPEDFRTAWLSEREGRAMTTLARSLVGRHCRFGKRLESTRTGQQRVRMCEWIEELGPDPASVVSPIKCGVEALAGPGWAERFTSAGRQAALSEAELAAIVRHATRGRTLSARAVRSDEVEAVREAFRALAAGRLTASTVEGTVVLQATAASAA